MLILRKEQIEALTRGVRSQFESELQTWLREQYLQVRIFGEKPADLRAARGRAGAWSWAGQPAIVDLMQLLYPRKYATMTSEIRDHCAKGAGRKITDYGLTDRPTTVLLVILMFLLGSGRDRDLLYSWIQDALSDHSPDPAAQGQRPLAGFWAYLRQVINVVGG